MDHQRIIWILYIWCTLPSLLESINPTSCTTSGACVALGDHSSCLGAALPYAYTSLDFANDSSSLDEVMTRLTEWSGLQGAPRCWEVIQPMLCAIYMPRCNDSIVEMYPRELCLKTRNPCDIVRQVNGDWPDFLKCDQPHFTTQPGCEAETYRQLKFHYNSTCMYPLVRTTNEDSYYEDVDGCGIQCENPMFSSTEHDRIHIFIGIMASLCMISTLITLGLAVHSCVDIMIWKTDRINQLIVVFLYIFNIFCVDEFHRFTDNGLDKLKRILTFLVDWKNSKKHPALIIFYINLCFCVGSVGWLAQFGGNREEIVCRKDMTMRRSEPQLGAGEESGSCTAVFVIVYFCMMAGVTWFVVLAYAWHVSFKRLQTGSIEDKLEGKIAYFHIISWCGPLILTIVCLSIQKVDGDSLSGICFVGYVDDYARGLLVLLPITLTMAAGVFFLLQGLITLIKMRKGSPQSMSDKATAKITETILRLGIFLVLAFVFVFITLVVHIYDFHHKNQWQDSFKEFVICKAKVNIKRELHEAEPVCEFGSRPNLTSIYLNVFAYFGAGIMMSSWTWNRASKEVWRRFLRKLFKIPTNKPVKLKKHKMIAQAFEKRVKRGKGGNDKLSMDFHTSHDDPLGMRIDLGSVTSHDMSSAWMDAMPKLVRRRGGVALPVAGTLRRYSDSDISSMCTASRRASLDSQASQKDRTTKPKNGKKREGPPRGRHRGLTHVVPADIHAFNARRRGSNLSQKSIEDLRNHLNRRISNASSHISHASAHSIAIDCIDTANNSKRNSVDGTMSTTELQEMTLATYSFFTASALLPAGEDIEMGAKKSKPKSAHSGSSGGRSSSGVSSNKMNTPTHGFVNDAMIDDDEISDVSI